MALLRGFHLQLSHMWSCCVVFIGNFLICGLAAWFSFTPCFASYVHLPAQRESLFLSDRMKSARKSTHIIANMVPQTICPPEKSQKVKQAAISVSTQANTGDIPFAFLYIPFSPRLTFICNYSAPQNNCQNTGRSACAADVL